MENQDLDLAGNSQENSGENYSQQEFENSQLADLQRQVEQEKGLRQKYEEALSSLDKDLSIHADNQNVLKDVQEKYKDIYVIPEIKQAIDAYLKLDMDPRQSLKEQGFPEAIEYIASIYKSGYETASRVRSQNNAAKSRMDSAIVSGVPSQSSGRSFSRADIASMDQETFAKYEKVIFDQMAKGLIK